jgi:hypothetical protein
MKRGTPPLDGHSHKKSSRIFLFDLPKKQFFGKIKGGAGLDSVFGKVMASRFSKGRA